MRNLKKSPEVIIATLILIFCPTLVPGQMAKEIEATILVGQVIDKVNILIEKIEESHKSLEAKVEESQKAMEAKVEDINTKFIDVKNQCSEERTDLRDLLMRDECADGTHNCSEWASCKDGLGSYTCSCLPGYTGDGFTCTENIPVHRYRLAGFDHRYAKPGSVWKSIDASLKDCENSCFASRVCVSFNHKETTNECEMLSTAYHMPTDLYLVPASGWNYYLFKAPGRPENASSYCPHGSVYLQYEQPIYLKYDFSLDGYTCTSDDRIVEEHDLGKQCTMKIMYGVDFLGYDTAYSYVLAHYYEAWKSCNKFNCVAMICMPSAVRCWLKYENHLTISKPLSPYPALLYWYPECL